MYSRVKRPRKVIKRDMYGIPIQDQESSDDNKKNSYKVSVHLAKRFQRRRFFKLTNQRQELPMAAMFVNGSGRNE
jgi:hypothetical protein